MKRVSLAILIGVLITPLLFALAGILSAACHCITPTTLIFPYAAITLEKLSADSIGLLLIAIQFPLYAVVLGRWPKKKVIVFSLLAFHVAATLVSLMVAKH
jgi:Na+/H+-translocating membrane pyrophosphatase